MDCIEVCPVDCFYAGKNMLVIHPDECIDCGVCEPECPAQAIKPDTEPGLEDWLKLNREYAAKWPLTAKELPPAEISISGVKSIEIKLTNEPRWMLEMMRPQAKAISRFGLSPVVHFDDRELNLPIKGAVGLRPGAMAIETLRKSNNWDLGTMFLKTVSFWQSINPTTRKQRHES